MSLRREFLQQYNVCFDPNGNITKCGREACKTLISIASAITKDTNTIYGDENTGRLDVAKIKELYSTIKAELPPFVEGEGEKEMCDEVKSPFDTILEHRLHQLRKHFKTCGVSVDVSRDVATGGISIVCPDADDFAKFVQSISGPVVGLTPEEQVLVEDILLNRKQAIKIRYMDACAAVQEDALSAYAFDATEIADALRSCNTELKVVSDDKASEYNEKDDDDFIMKLVSFKQTYYILIMDSKFSPLLPFSYTCCDVQDNEYIRIKK